jgi:thiol-disulfide isomerase/thioredoxin
LVPARAAAAALLLALSLTGASPTLTRARAEPNHRAAPENGKAPPFRLVDVEGIKGLLRQSRGHVVLLHFWASWCGPCMEELPLIDKFARDMKPRGLEVLSLSLDDPARAAARVGALLRRSAPNLTPNIAQFDDADALIAAIDPRWVGAIPALFVYDHQGKLRGNVIGESSRAELEQLVGELLKAAAQSTAAAHPPAEPPAAATKATP